MIEAVIFLGNPGKKYENTRHNAPWLLEPRLSFSSRLIWQNKFNGLYAREKIEGQNRYFLKPQTFMNKSGESAGKMLQFFKIPVENCLVIHDEIELEFGMISFRKGGGMGGHNGLRSIRDALGSQDFYRFRLGVSRPGRETVSSYVLSPFNPREMVVLENFMTRGAEILEICLAKDVKDTEKQYNKCIVI